MESSCACDRKSCKPNGKTLMSLSRQEMETKQPDHIVFDISANSKRTCDYEVLVDFDGPRQLLLRGIPRSSLSDSPRNDDAKIFVNCKITWTQASKAAGNTVLNNVEISVGWSRTFALRQRGSLSLSCKIEKSEVALSIHLMVPGYCAQNMVHHQGSCYEVVRPQIGSLDGALSSISASSSAGVQLATFTSMDDIRSFVQANAEPNEDELPPKKDNTLELTEQPVRIGMFYSKQSNSVFRVVSREGRCQREDVKKMDQILAEAAVLDGPCGYLQITGNPSQVNVTFTSCDLRGPSLVGLPETPRNGAGADCNETIIKQLSEEPLVFLAPGFRLTALIAAVAAASAVVVALVTVSICVIRCRQQREPAANSKQGQLQEETNRLHSSGSSDSGDSGDSGRGSNELAAVNTYTTAHKTCGFDTWDRERPVIHVV